MKYSTQKRKAASERGRRMAARRWELDRERRSRMAALDPLAFSDRIVRRIVVIFRETTVKEAVFLSTDSLREARRKLREVLAEPR